MILVRGSPYPQIWPVISCNIFLAFHLEPLRLYSLVTSRTQTQPAKSTQTYPSRNYPSSSTFTHAKSAGWMGPRVGKESWWQVIKVAGLRGIMAIDHSIYGHRICVMLSTRCIWLQGCRRSWWITSGARLERFVYGVIRPYAA
jgi:hypothetical protein